VRALPPPQVRAHRREVTGRGEAELALRERGVRGEVGDVAAPAADDGGLVAEAGRGAHRLDDLQHGLPAALAEVVRLVARGARGRAVEEGGGGRERVEGEEVALGEVEDVDVVPDAGAIARALLDERRGRDGREDARRGVVIAEDLERVLLHAPNSHVGEEREEVARAASGIFADLAGWMCAGRAE
jgi:hypothetical protein